MIPGGTTKPVKSSIGTYQVLPLTPLQMPSKAEIQLQSLIFLQQKNSGLSRPVKRPLNNRHTSTRNNMSKTTGSVDQIGANNGSASVVDQYPRKQMQANRNPNFTEGSQKLIALLIQELQIAQQQILSLKLQRREDVKDLISIRNSLV